MRLYKKFSCLWIYLGLITVLPAVAEAYSYGIAAESVLKQARQRNVQYFQLLRRYGTAIDMVDQSGNTAYCLAMRHGDQQTMSFLASQGANVNHSCVRRLEKAQQQAKEAQARREEAMKRKTISKNAFKTDGIGNKYLWWGLGTLAVGGGVAAALSNSGGGSSHHGGSDDGPFDPDDPDDPETEKFKTTEYKTGNFLRGIRAAKAYSNIYTLDEKGVAHGHQADSDLALEKVKVGVIDSGVFANKDLSGKVKKSYDLNIYNEDASFYSYIKGDEQAVYVIKKANKYYVLGYDKDDNPQWWYTDPVKKSELEIIIKSKCDITFDDLSLVNANGGANPGTSMEYVIFDYSNPRAMLNSWYGYMTELSHGTHVAGIIAANRNGSGMHGVAFDNAELYAVSWDMEEDDEHRLINPLYKTVKSMVDDGVKVFNNSWGWVYDEDTFPYDARYASIISKLKNGPDFLESYAYVAKNGAVWVQATGNDGHDQPALDNGTPKLDLSAYGYDGPKEYEAPYVAVAALDPETATKGAPSGKIADYSNRCGVANEYCLAAPGSEIVSTGMSRDGVLTMEGTSMATPVVSGSIALLKGYYPWLSAQNVAWLLLETANNSGEYANKEIYGKGALDLGSAVTTPIGNLGLPTKSEFNNMKAAANSKLLLGSVAQSKFKNSLPKTVTAFDVLNRPFEYETSKLVSATHASNANFRNEVSHAAISKPSRVIKDEKSGFTFSSQESLAKNGQEHLSEVSVVHETDKGSTRFYYAENSQYTNAESAVKPTANPYMAMNEAYGAEHTLNLSDVSRLKLSLQTGENGLYGRDYEQDHQSFDERAYGMGAEYSFDLTDYLELSALGGLLYEEEAMLGMNGRGGFALKDGSTYYAGIKAMFNVTPNFTILAAYYRGYTEGRDTSLMSMSNLETESYMIAGEYKLNKENKVGLSLMSPMSVVKGKSSFRYASGRDNYSDTIYMRKLTSSLKPAAKEYDLGMYYIGEPKEDLNITGKIEARFNADGEKGVTDYLGIMGMHYAFPQ